VDGNAAIGINKDPTQGAVRPQLTEFNEKLYFTWDEFDGNFEQIRVSTPLQ